MKIYNTKTQEAYDALMSELEEKGFEWFIGGKPTSNNLWNEDKENSCIKVYGDDIFNGSIEWYQNKHPSIPIIEYKSEKQGEKQMITYHTATEEDYNSLMIELEKQGFRWGSIRGKKPTEEFYYDVYTSETTITTFTDVIRYGRVKEETVFRPDEPIIEYKAKKQVVTDDFIKELTVKIYYNEITKKHYTSYEEAIADCKKEMERQYDKN